MGKHVIVQRRWFEGSASPRGESRVSGPLEGERCCPLHMNVIWMAITPDGIESEHHVRFQLSDVPDNPFRNFLDRMRDLGFLMNVVRHPGHAGVSITQKMNPCQPEMPGRTAKLGLTQLGN